MMIRFETQNIPPQSADGTPRVIQRVDAVSADNAGLAGDRQTVGLVQSGAVFSGPLDDRSLDAQVEEAISQLIGEDIGSARLRIDQDEESGRVVFQSVDRDSGEVINQFPPETILKLIASIREAEGIVLDTSV
ncbi:hypothetical protein GCM10007972_18680 [Iodidimonas muriae]|uniref:Flagellar protein FlaG n=1 Tax=Iodidimonas muriae TaxID=261467 RepID=A0ABQ2LED3_9PROT|nr:flagellar protein FlaG [Iodidimonas muriae]GGO12983.1 hypothetical protein GCM10007972_18680 [Iodidimonas muriae]